MAWLAVVAVSAGAGCGGPGVGAPAGSLPDAHEDPARSFARLHREGSVAGLRAFARAHGSPPCEPGKVAGAEAFRRLAAHRWGDVTAALEHDVASAGSVGEMTPGPRTTTFPFRAYTVDDAVTLHQRRDGFLGVLMLAREEAAAPNADVPPSCLGALAAALVELSGPRRRELADDLWRDVSYGGMAAYDPAPAGAAPSHRYFTLWPYARARLALYLPLVVPLVGDERCTELGPGPAAEAPGAVSRWVGAGRPGGLGCTVAAVEKVVAFRDGDRKEGGHP